MAKKADNTKREVKKTRRRFKAKGLRHRKTIGPKAG